MSREGRGCLSAVIRIGELAKFGSRTQFRGTQESTRVTEAVLTREIFDRLRQATAGQPDVLAELCREYVAEARSTIAQLHHAVAAQDAHQLRERAHYLKGSSMMIGAQQLVQCCATLEKMGRDAELGQAAVILEETMAALKAVEDELTVEVGAAVLPGEGSAA